MFDLGLRPLCRYHAHRGLKWSAIVHNTFQSILSKLEGNEPSQKQFLLLLRDLGSYIRKSDK